MSFLYCQETLNGCNIIIRWILEACDISRFHQLYHSIIFYFKYLYAQLSYLPSSIISVWSLIKVNLFIYCNYCIPIIYNISSSVCALGLETGPSPITGTTYSSRISIEANHKPKWWSSPSNYGPVTAKPSTKASYLTPCACRVIGSNLTLESFQHTHTALDIQPNTSSGIESQHYWKSSLNWNDKHWGKLFG